MMHRLICVYMAMAIALTAAIQFLAPPVRAFSGDPTHVARRNTDAVALPRTRAEVMQSLQRGDEVTVVEFYGLWRGIRIDDRRLLWVRAADLLSMQSVEYTAESVIAAVARARASGDPLPAYLIAAHDSHIAAMQRDPAHD